MGLWDGRVGDTNPDDTPNKLNGWKQYGFNVDGLVSTAMSVDLCKPKQGGQPSNTYPDGDNGIDNSFGKNVMPILNAASPDFAASVNEAITTGKFTLIGHLEGLGPDPDMPSLTSRFYTGAALGDNPKFDGTDCWPVAQESLTDPAAIESAKVLFDKSSVTSNMWSSGGNTTLELSLPSAAFGVPIKLTIYQARLSMILDPDHGGALGGQIGGVLDTEEVAAEVKKVAGAIDPSLCSGPTTEAILTQIRQASDIMKDGTQDPAQECDGISIGLGFKMEQIGLSYIEQPAPPSPDPCAP